MVVEGGADYANKDDGTGPMPMAMVGGTDRVNSGGRGQTTLVVRARNMIGSNGGRSTGPSQREPLVATHQGSRSHR